MEPNEGTGDRSPKAPSSSLSILVVDDNQMMRCVIERMLAALLPGCVCSVSSCGKEMLGAVRQGVHHLALVDLSMPDMSGKDVARHVREIEREQGRSPMPLIAISASPLAEEWTECRRAGFTTFVQKPFNASILRVCIQSVLPQAFR